MTLSMDDIISRTIEKRRNGFDGSESTWQTFYEVWKAVGKYLVQQMNKGMVRGGCPFSPLRVPRGLTLLAWWG